MCDVRVLSVCSEYDERVCWDGVLGGCAGRVYWEGVLGGCTGMVYWDGVLRLTAAVSWSGW